MHTIQSIVTRVLILAVTAVLMNVTLAQESGTIKEQAETQLQQMSPEEIEARIKQLGMTRAEAEAKAREYGIDLDQYLRSQTPGTTPQQSPSQNVQQQYPGLYPDLSAFGPDTARRAAPRLRGPSDSTGARLTAPSDSLRAAMLRMAPTPIPGFEGRKGVEGLPLFGYDIFNFPSSTFEPVLNMPTPQDYTLGPGDEVNLTMWGENQLYLQLVVNREGQITVPNVGPIVVQGMTITQLKSQLLSRLTNVISSLRNGRPGATTWLDLSLGKLRSMEIFVLGEVKKPGGYAVSSMSTGLLGLYVAGGPTVNGSLREIKIIRDNKPISTIDFYDFALKGDRLNDVRLQDGDVIFVKPAGRRVALTGRVVRPAIYELKAGETLGDLLTLSGGLLATSYVDRVHVERIIPFDERKKYLKNILDIDVLPGSVEELRQSRFTLEDGDIVSVLKINGFFENRVTISGNVRKPGVFELSEGMRVRDLVRLADGYLPDTFEDRGNILRTLPNQRKEVVPFNLARAMGGDTLDNVRLQSEDEITIYNKRYFSPEHSVTIGGAVRKPGSVLRTEHLKVSDLIVLAGGLTDDAMTGQAIVTRIDTTSQSIFSKSYTVDLSPNYWQSGQPNDLELMDYDFVFIPTNPHYHTTKLVSVNGEVMYPGTYAILYDGERLASIIKRAGGVRQGAYIDGARLVRSHGGAGLVPVDFRDALEHENDKANIEVVEGDQIFIDRNPHVVYVRGEVGVPSAVVYEEGAGLNYYLRQAGGVKDTGDENHIVVIQPNGRKWTSSWFFAPNSEILAGAMITVPVKVEHEDKTLPVLRDWTTILASLATMMVVIVQISK